MRFPLIKLLAIWLVALGAESVFAIETRPFRVREFKTHEIKFKSHSDKADESERRSDARDRRAAREREDADEREERKAEERERNERERELKRQLEENKRQQKELQKARDRELAEEWKVYLAELRQSNEVLKTAVKVKRDRVTHQELYCGLVFEDGRSCPNRAIEGKWFCLEHDEPPLAKDESPIDIPDRDETTEMIGKGVEPSAKVACEPAVERKPKGKRPISKPQGEPGRDGSPSLTFCVVGTMIALCVGSVLMFVWVFKTGPSRSRV